jgi:hypothetical protein
MDLIHRLWVRKNDYEYTYIDSFDIVRWEV